MSAASEIETLWYEHQGDLRRYARRYVVSDMADDLVQDVFCRALGAMRNGKGYKTSARGWLYRIMRNLIIDHYRTRDVRPEFVELDVLVGDDENDRNCKVAERIAATLPTPYEAAERNLTVTQVRSALNGLPVRQMEFMEAKMQGYNNADIAGEIDTDVANVRATCTRAYANLRDRLRATR